jgi:hypothetical protein
VCLPVVSFVLSDVGEDTFGIVQVVDCSVLNTSVVTAQLDHRSDKFEGAVSIVDLTLHIIPENKHPIYVFSCQLLQQQQQQQQQQYSPGQNQ